MQVIDYIHEQVDLIFNGTVPFVHQSFLFDATTQSWQPAQMPNKDFPVVLGDVFRISYTEDLRLKTWHLSLVFLADHKPDTTDVPNIHRKAEIFLIQILARLEALEDLVIESPPEINFFFNQTEARLAGANLLVSLSGANSPAPIC